MPKLMKRAIRYVRTDVPTLIIEKLCLNKLSIHPLEPVRDERKGNRLDEDCKKKMRFLVSFSYQEYNITTP